MLKTSRYAALAESMIAREGQDVSFQEMYEALCQEPHVEHLSVKALHAKCSKSRFLMRKSILHPRGYKLVQGNARNSFKVVKA